MVLAATAALFWFARRDLAARAAPAAAPPADTRELEQLCATLETLVTDLARRLDALERRDPLAAGVLPAVGAPLAAPSPAAEMRPSVPDPRHLPLYALLDEGVSDAAEIARRTGLARGEIELILSLRARRAL